MSNITVGRYSNPQEAGYFGWLEPEEKDWIMFVDLSNNPIVFLNRDSKTGVVN